MSGMTAENIGHPAIIGKVPNHEGRTPALAGGARAVDKGGKAVDIVSIVPS